MAVNPTGTPLDFFQAFAGVAQLIAAGESPRARGLRVLRATRGVGPEWERFQLEHPRAARDALQALEASLDVSQYAARRGLGVGSSLQELAALIFGAGTAGAAEYTVTRDAQGRPTSVRVVSPSGPDLVVTETPMGGTPRTTVIRGAGGSGPLTRGRVRTAADKIRKLPKLPAWARGLGFSSVLSLLLYLVQYGVEWISDPVKRKAALDFLRKYGNIIGQGGYGVPGQVPTVPQPRPARRVERDTTVNRQAVMRAETRRTPLPVPGALLPGPIAAPVITPRRIPGLEPAELPKVPTRRQRAARAARGAFRRAAASPAVRAALLALLTPSPRPLRGRLTLKLTGFEPAGVASLQPQTAAGGAFDRARPSQTLEDQCRELRKRKRKPRKPRVDCYRGIYRETATGLIKERERRIPCRPSRKR